MLEQVRADVDDTSRTGPVKVRQRRLDHVDGARNGPRELLCEGAVTDLVCLCPRITVEREANQRVVDHRGNRGVESPMRLRDERVDLCPVANVSLYRDCPAGMRGGQLCGCRATSVVVDYHSRSLAKERLGDAAAESTATARHHD